MPPVYDDDLDDELYADDNQTERDPKDKVIGRLKAENKELKRFKTETEPRLTELEGFYSAVAAEKKASAVMALSMELGIPAGPAALLADKLGDEEPTKEILIPLAVKYGLLAPTEKAEEPDLSKSFAPVELGGSAPGLSKLSYKQWQKLQANDMPAAIKAYEEDRIDWDTEYDSE